MDFNLILKCKRNANSYLAKDDEEEILTWIVKEIQFDRNMCDPNSYCFLPIEFSIQEIENVENFQHGKTFGPIYKVQP